MVLDATGTVVCLACRNMMSVTLQPAISSTAARSVSSTERFRSHSWSEGVSSPIRFSVAAIASPVWGRHLKDRRANGGCASTLRGPYAAAL